MKSIKSLLVLGACIGLMGGIVSFANAAGKGECLKACADTLKGCVDGASGSTAACVASCQETTPPDAECLQACGEGAVGGNDACTVAFEDCRSEC